MQAATAAPMGIAQAFGPLKDLGETSGREASCIYVFSAYAALPDRGLESKPTSKTCGPEHEAGETKQRTKAKRAFNEPIEQPPDSNAA